MGHKGAWWIEWTREELERKAKTYAATGGSDVYFPVMLWPWTEEDVGEVEPFLVLVVHPRFEWTYGLPARTVERLMDEDLRAHGKSLEHSPEAQWFVRYVRSQRN